MPGFTQPREPAYWTCGSCGEHLLNQEDIAGECRACHSDVLCVGCIFDCADCGKDFCQLHIKTLDGADGYATYLCSPCLAERDAIKLLEAA